MTVVMPPLQATAEVAAPAERAARVQTADWAATVARVVRKPGTAALAAVEETAPMVSVPAASGLLRVCGRRSRLPVTAARD